MADIQQILSNSCHESFESLIQQRITARWLNGDFPFVARKSVSGLRKKVPVSLPDGKIILHYHSGGNTNILQEANDNSWILSTSLQRKYDCVHYIVAAKKQSLPEELVNFLSKGIQKKTVVDPNKINVKFWYMDSMNGPQAICRKIDIRPWNDIQENYVESIQEPLRRLMHISPKDIKGRIILMHGPAGTGKTTLLRALGGSWREWCDISYILDPDIMLNNGTYMMHALLDDGDSSKWRLVIMEDSGELFSKNAKKDTGQALSRLLNMTDGILGQGRKIIFALTTNEPGSIHAAVMRPGRAMANLQVPAFSTEEASKWLGRSVSDKMECTLANLLSLRNPEKIEVITTSAETAKHSVGQYL